MFTSNEYFAGKDVDIKVFSAPDWDQKTGTTLNSGTQPLQVLLKSRFSHLCAIYDTNSETIGESFSYLLVCSIPTPPTTAMSSFTLASKQFNEDYGTPFG